MDETAHSREGRDHDDWDPTWLSHRFMMFLRCENKQCREVVVACGFTEMGEVIDEENGLGFQDLLVPISITPAPPIISVPKGTPSTVEGELNMAFQLFWCDLGASATKIRTSVERLMDHFKVAKFKRTGGRLRPIDLYNRIEAFIAKNGKVVHKDHLHALRVVGNLGTHANAATRSDVLEAFQVYEHALDELIGKKSAAITKLAQKLKKKKK
jgi:hypothetical protein